MWPFNRLDSLQKLAAHCWVKLKRLLSRNRMNQTTPVRSRAEWMKLLSDLSPAVAGVAGSDKLPDIKYQDAATREFDHRDAYNLANDDTHSAALARCFDGLAKKGADNASLLKFLTDLTGGDNTYGTGSELLTYLWLLDHQVLFEFQVPMTGQQILNPNGSDLDGKLTWGTDVFFDIKGFGFQEALIDELRGKLAAKFPGKWLAVEGTWDVAIETIQQLFHKRNFTQLLSDITQNGIAFRDGPQFVLREQARVQVSHRTVDPYQLAQENSRYVFRFAKQYCRDAPFILFLAPHPWFGLSFNSDFAGVTSTFARSLARRVFIEFLNDHPATDFQISFGEASRLVSGIAFLNTWPSPDGNTPLLRLFLNPNAKHPVPDLTVDCLKLEDPQAVAVERFTYDNY
jgi:hypothetical protein